MEDRRTGREENVRVYVRARPLNENESQSYTKGTIEIDKDNDAVRLNNNEYREYEKNFRFHGVFSEESSQIQIYQMVAAPIVETVLNGFNGTILAYGQTGSGKTYTMVGDHTSEELQGIIPNSFSQIFGKISRSAVYRSFVVTVTFLEIYNEEIKDLLSPNSHKKLVIHDHKKYGSYVKDLSGFTVNSVQEMMKLFKKGNKNRTTKSNAINIRSSRSHAIFTIMVESKNRNTNETTIGKLNFVDLAGSERLSRTKATGDMLKEASHINLSLSVLGNVISSLVDEKASHVPYRNSKLTRLLQDSLGGNSKTAIIATLSMSEIDYDESYCTLRYATKVRYIKNYISANKKEDGIIASFEKQIQELRKKIQTIDDEQKVKRHKQNDLKMKMNEKKKIEDEIINTENMKQELITKIETLQQKIIVGGINLLDKFEEQKFLLEQSSSELQTIYETNKNLEEVLTNKGKEKIELERNYTSLQEENEDLDRQILLVQNELQQSKIKLRQQQSEQQFEIEKKMDEKRSLSHDISLYNLVLDNIIPKVYRKKIESNIKYNKNDDEFSLNHVAYAGNNVFTRSDTSATTLENFPNRMKSPFIRSRKRRRREARKHSTVANPTKSKGNSMPILPRTKSNEY